MSEDEYVRTQVFASAPDQPILLNTATAFLQGLYPPLEGLDADLVSQTLVNGSESESPLDGYQYVVLSGVQDNSPDTIWIKGDDACPAYKDASKSFKQSREFKQREEETKDFYEGFYDMLQDGVYNIKRENLTYANAYNIFDLINVAHIHNESSPAANVSESDLFQLRTLADSAELGLNYNSSQLARSIGADTLSGAVLSHLNQTVASKGQKKFSLLAGSYDTFLAFFGLSKLTFVSEDFFGLPAYASTMAFELFTSQNVTVFPSNTEDLRVRFLFRNGSRVGDTPQVFSLFGGSADSLSYSDFVTKMKEFAITTPEQWCGVCGSDALFCDAFSARNAERKGSGISNAVAGVIGAFVALSVVAVVGAALFFVLRRRSKTVPVAQIDNEKGSMSSGRPSM